MPSFGAMLGAVASPLAKKVLSGLGIGMVSYAGVDVIFTALKAQIASSWSGMAPDILGLLGLVGVGTGVNYIVAAMAARVAMLSLSHLGKLV